ncbi:hypothetical protein A8709_24580 [Paenibacillus pectinilyticus]|uniref:Uncharacterized protein n=1 Tax=Paenibacillus pectinilyticus TaxID=512399 RepID=A0A1C1A976_9BACL|nr:hypothetical protein [Paenibacillus pectinilyticus]OCT17159.1 hypothetical protein A8709_24580 [Paenibacillus pectinilyticus]
MTKVRKWLTVGWITLAIMVLFIVVKILIPTPATQAIESIQPTGTALPNASMQPQETVRPDENINTQVTVQPNQNILPIETAQPKENMQPSSARWYDPSQLGIGDSIGGWNVVDLKLETYGKGSKAFILEGEAQISGTFTVNYAEDTYNSHQIILLADDNPSRSLPKPLAFGGSSSRMILHLSNPDDRKQFGEPGSKGRVTVTIHQYQSVYADILEGVSDTAEVTQLDHITSTPPPLTEVLPTELTQALRSHPLVPIELNDKSLTASTTYELIQGWFLQLNKQYISGLEPFTLKRISPEQKDQIQSWLMQAFTAAQAEEISAMYVQKSGIHYIIGGGYLPFRPNSEVKEISQQSIQMEGSDTLQYTGVYILSGMHDVQFSYTLKRIGGVWKIDQIEMKLI